MKTLKSARKDAGFTQCEFAKTLGLAQSTYSQYETGKHTVSAEVAAQICLILGVDQEDIFLPKIFTVRRVEE